MAICIVTGVAGFIGSHLAETLLAERHNVVGVDSLTANYARSIKLDNLTVLLRHPKFRFIETRIEHLRRDDIPWDDAYVFHLAGQPGVRDSWGAGFQDFAQNNVIATQCLLDLLRINRPQRLILASSSSVYGSANADRLMQESDETTPLSPYGVTKLAAEQLCLVYAHEYSINTSILRFFSVFGPRQRPDMFAHRLLAAAAEQRPINIFGSLVQRRDFTYVSDIVNACTASIDMIH
jgi:nucleoside-diphosphate-sugar epimerase